MVDTKFSLEPLSRATMPAPHFSAFPRTFHRFLALNAFSSFGLRGRLEQELGKTTWIKTNHVSCGFGTVEVEKAS